MALAPREERVVHISKRTCTTVVIFVVVVVLFGWIAAVGGTRNVISLIDALTRIIGIIAPFGILISVLLLFWGLGTYITDSPSDPDKNVRLGRKRIVHSILLFLVLAILWGLTQFMQQSFGVQYSSSNLRNAEIPYVGAPVDKSSSPAYMPERYQESPTPLDITDTREFMKTSYTATLKTRDVRGMARNAKSIIREVEGRIDSEEVTEKYASLRFVVPQNKFESFRDEIENLVHTKLYVENVSSKNLLGQKQGIEQRTASEAGYRANLEQQKQSLDSNHAVTSSAYKSELASIVSQLATVRAQLRTAVDPQERSLLQIQETTLVNRESSVRQSIATENKTYNTRSAELASQIANSDGALSNLSSQDTQLLNNVATVTGSISIEWASLWALAVLLSHIHPVWIILVLILLAWWLGRRMRIIPRIEFV